MFTLRTALLLSLAGVLTQAADFHPLMKVAQNTWPAKTHIGVVCDYHRHPDQVLDLLNATNPEYTITVADVHATFEAERAASLLQRRKVDFVILLDDAGLIQTGSLEGTLLVQQLARKGIPTVAINPLAIRQGAVFTVGEKGLALTERQVGTLNVPLPNPATLSLGSGASSPGRTM
jgi:hypothetical protein